MREGEEERDEKKRERRREKSPSPLLYARTLMRMRGGEMRRGRGGISSSPLLVHTRVCKREGREGIEK